MEIKATLQYSNPQIIREFALPKDFTARQLYQTICISTEWDTRRDATFYRNGKVLEDSAKITEELFAEGATLACVVGNVEQPDWYFRIEQVESPDPTLQPEYPILVRYRGGAILSQMKNVVEVNRYRNGWYGAPDEIMLATINIKLEKAFYKQSAKSADHVTRFIGKSCAEALSQMKVDKLKKIQANLEMDYATVKLKKQRVEEIAQKYMTDQNVMQKILEEMGMIEYETFLTLYETRESIFVMDDEEQFRYQTLLYYGLVTLGGNGKVIVSPELIMGAKPFMSNIVKDDLKRKHIVKTVIEAGTELYGFVNEQLYHVLLESCYSGMLTETQSKTYWNFMVKKAEKEQTRFMWLEGVNVFLNQDPVPYLAIIDEYYDADVATKPFYIPERATAERIELYRTTIDEATVLPLIKALQARFYYAKDHIYQYIYDAIQRCLEGETPEKAMRLIFRTFGAGNRGKEIAQMALELKKILSKIRQPRYLGHTKEEYEALTGGKQK